MKKLCLAAVMLLTLNSVRPVAGQPWTYGEKLLAQQSCGSTYTTTEHYWACVIGVTLYGDGRHWPTELPWSKDRSHRSCSLVCGGAGDPANAARCRHGCDIAKDYDQ
jgi:hypothetical protein